MTTPYGRTLALKAAIVAAVLVVASRSRAVRAGADWSRLAAGGGRGRPGQAWPPPARTPVATWIAFEVAGMVAIVGISALLTAQPPPV